MAREVTTLGRNDAMPSSLPWAAAHGRPEAKDLEGSARQAPRSARDLGTARLDVRELRLAEAVAPRLPDLQDLPRSRGPAAARPRPVGGEPDAHPRRRGRPGW